MGTRRTLSAPHPADTCPWGTQCTWLRPLLPPHTAPWCTYPSTPASCSRPAQSVPEHKNRCTDQWSATRPRSDPANTRRSTIRSALRSDPIDQTRTASRLRLRGPTTCPLGTACSTPCHGAPQTYPGGRSCTATLTFGIVPVRIWCRRSCALTHSLTPSGSGDTLLRCRPCRTGRTGSGCTIRAGCMLRLRP